MIKAAFFDIDGTLFSHKTHRIPPSTIKAVNKIRDKGIYTCICTGRHLGEVKAIDFSPMIFDYTICLNGQVIFDKDENAVYSHPFEDEDLKNITTLFNDKSIAIMAIELENYYLNTVTEAVVYAHNAISIKVPKIGELSGKPIYQLICYGTEEEIFSVASKVNGRAVWWNKYSVDIIPNSGGKDKGILTLCESLNIKSDEIITFGDGFNDIPMFKITPYSVAMGNAADEVKKEASYVTRDIDDDGIFSALEHFGLIS